MISWKHIDYIEDLYLPEPLEDFLPMFSVPQVLKWDTSNNRLEVLFVPQFDTMPEPVVVTRHTFTMRLDGRVLEKGRFIYQKPMILLNKWKLVGEDYEGFDLAEAKALTHSYPKTLRKRVLLSQAALMEMKDAYTMGRSRVEQRGSTGL